MAGLSYLNLKPLSWSQSIDFHPGLKGIPSQGYTRIIVTCMPTANCDVLLATGASLRDYQIEIQILEGQLPNDHPQRSKFESDALGGLWFDTPDCVHGWFYLKSKIYDTLWDQLRDGKADWQISLGVRLSENESWKENPLSIVSASLTFDRRPLADQKARQKSWLSRLSSR